jgi:hypothetical protein
VFQWGVIILSALVPAMVVSLPETAKWITAVVAVILAIGTAGLKTFKFQENWVNYRTVAESLKKEKVSVHRGIALWFRRRPIHPVKAAFVLGPARHVQGVHSSPALWARSILRAN